MPNISNVPGFPHPDGSFGPLVQSTSQNQSHLNSKTLSNKAHEQQNSPVNKISAQSVTKQFENDVKKDK